MWPTAPRATIEFSCGSSTLSAHSRLWTSSSRAAASMIRSAGSQQHKKRCDKTERLRLIPTAWGLGGIGTR
eukprot:16031898-Heterocapsa_arctica.AAC.1